MSLNDEQLLIVKQFENNSNVFITGSGGVGKTYILKYIVNLLKDKQKKVGICAMTGSAAILIDGTTLHSFMGIGLGKESVDYLVIKISKNAKLRKKIFELGVLIIDEVSMLDSELFTKISDIFKNLKKSESPFGGIQVILVGDLFQLAPIGKNYCFLSTEWDKTNFSTFLLKTNVRQKNDTVFKDLLERLRWGRCSDEDYKILLSLKKTVFPPDIIPTRLYSKNSEVDKINSDEYNNLFITNPEIKSLTYKIQYPKNVMKNAATKNWIKTVKIPESITLCTNAQVMITNNIDIEKGLINGTRGIVIELYEKSVKIKLVNEEIVIINYYKFKYADNPFIECDFLPIRLAWAISIHKSQGMTIDALEIDLGKDIFAYGQAYTALSRGKTMRSIKLIDVLKQSFKASPAVTAFYSDL